VDIADYLRESEELVEEGYGVAIEASPLHRGVVEMLRRMLEMMGQFSAGTASPAAKSLGAMGRSLRVLEPMLLEGFSDVPEEQIEAFIRGLIDEMERVLKEAKSAGPRARSDQSPAA
jgi:hypothetical protein